MLKAVAAAGTLLMSFPGWCDDVVRLTPQGTVIGAAASPEGDVEVFKGIPYGLPPVGVRRWRHSEPAPHWKGARLATEFGPECMQPSRPEDHLYYVPVPQMSEDCLYLNVWTPAGKSIDIDGKRPVMVWIHGGALEDGAGSRTVYDGTALARKRVVVVTINYRLHVFGYYSHPELTAESSHGASGNYGIGDQILALKWVRDNIIAFGGDPGNVTVFGESAGALSITYLLASPMAKGLFHRAIAQSPYLLPLLELKTRSYGNLSAEERGLAVALKAGQETISGLRQLPAGELLDAAKAAGFYPEAVVDHWVLPGQIFEIFERGEQHDVPVIFGFNSGEMYSFTRINGVLASVPPNAADYIAKVRARYGDLADDYLAQYPADDLREAVFAPARDGFFGWAADRLSRMTGNVRANAYLYYFDHQLELGEQSHLGAFHAVDLLFMFADVSRKARFSPNWPNHVVRKVDVQMAELISNYWISFARNGEPAVSGQPTWLPYMAENHNYMAFRNGNAEPGRDLLRGAFELFDKIVSRRRAQGNQSWSLTTIGLRAPEIVLQADSGEEETRKQR